MRVSLPFAPGPAEEPIRAELFGIERLEQHAESLAAAQHVRQDAGRRRRLASRVEDNGRVLREAYRAIARAIREERDSRDQNLRCSVGSVGWNCPHGSASERTSYCKGRG